MIEKLKRHLNVRHRMLGLFSVEALAVDFVKQNRDVTSDVS